MKLQNRGQVSPLGTVDYYWNKAGTDIGNLMATDLRSIDVKHAI